MTRARGRERVSASTRVEEVFSVAKGGGLVSRSSAHRTSTWQISKASAKAAELSVSRLADSATGEASATPSIHVSNVSALSIRSAGTAAFRKKCTLNHEMERIRLENRRIARRKEKLLAEQALESFLAYLLKKFGNFARAWRRALDVDGSMACTKPELFKACKRMGWQGDVRALWRALDADDNGAAVLEELHGPTARLLARFKVWGDQCFGDIHTAFARLCGEESVPERRHLKITSKDFVRRIRELGFVGGGVKTLYHCLDWDNKRFVADYDMDFLSRWHPKPYLTGKKNVEAATDLRAKFFEKFGGYLHAWQECLDRGHSGEVSWWEFVEGCHTVGFGGDLPGAWLAMDEDLSGGISYKEFDPVGFRLILDFKRWCRERYGYVEAAFEALVSEASRDEDQNLTYGELRRTCRDLGFRGDTHRLFHMLEKDGSGHVMKKDVLFMDNGLGFDDDVELDEVLLRSAPSVPEHLGTPNAYGHEQASHSKMSSLESVLSFGNSLSFIPFTSKLASPNSPRSPSPPAGEANAPTPLLESWQQAKISSAVVPPVRSSQDFLRIREAEQALLEEAFLHERFGAPPSSRTARGKKMGKTHSRFASDAPADVSQT